MKTLFIFITICAFALVNIKGNSGCSYNPYYEAASCFAAYDWSGIDHYGNHVCDVTYHSASDTWYIPANRTIFYSASVSACCWYYNIQNYGCGTVYFGPFTWHVQHYGYSSDTSYPYSAGGYGTVDSGLEGDSFWTVGVSAVAAVANLQVNW